MISKVTLDILLRSYEFRFSFRPGVLVRIESIVWTPYQNRGASTDRLILGVKRGRRFGGAPHPPTEEKSVFVDEFSQTDERKSHFRRSVDEVPISGVICALPRRVNICK